VSGCAAVPAGGASAASSRACAVTASASSGAPQPARRAPARCSSAAAASSAHLAARAPLCFKTHFIPDLHAAAACAWLFTCSTSSPRSLLEGTTHAALQQVCIAAGLRRSRPASASSGAHLALDMPPQVAALGPPLGPPLSLALRYYQQTFHTFVTFLEAQTPHVQLSCTPTPTAPLLVAGRGRPAPWQIGAALVCHAGRSSATLRHRVVRRTTQPCGGTMRALSVRERHTLQGYAVENQQCK